MRTDRTADAKTFASHMQQQAAAARLLDKLYADLGAALAGIPGLRITAVHDELLIEGPQDAIRAAESLLLDQNQRSAVE